MTSRAVRIVAGLIVCAGSIRMCQAATVFSSFLAGNTYECCAGSFVGGPTANFPGPNPGLSQVAGAFTPLDNFTLTQIDVAFRSVTYFGLPFVSGFDLLLTDDAGGLPGTTIETWTGLTSPLVPVGPSSFVESIFSASNVTL